MKSLDKLFCTKKLNLLFSKKWRDLLSNIQKSFPAFSQEYNSSFAKASHSVKAFKVRSPGGFFFPCPNLWECSWVSGPEQRLRGYPELIPCSSRIGLRMVVSWVSLPSSAAMAWDPRVQPPGLEPPLPLQVYCSVSAGAAALACGNPGSFHFLSLDTLVSHFSAIYKFVNVNYNI